MQLWIRLDSENIVPPSLRFGHLTRESYAASALDTTNLPLEQATKCIATI